MAQSRSKPSSRRSKRVTLSLQARVARRNNIRLLHDKHQATFQFIAEKWGVSRQRAHGIYHSPAPTQ